MEKEIDWEDVRKRFFAKVNIPDDHTRCWEWQGAKNADGYGWIKIGGVNMYAHRVAYMLEYGEIEENCYILHSCDNPSCCNHNHLSEGTSTENALDRVRKSRGTIKEDIKNLIDTYEEGSDIVRGGIKDATRIRVIRLVLTKIRADHDNVWVARKLIKRKLKKFIDYVDEWERAEFPEPQDKMPTEKLIEILLPEEFPSHYIEWIRNSQKISEAKVVLESWIPTPDAEEFVKKYSLETEGFSIEMHGYLAWELAMEFGSRLYEFKDVLGEEDSLPGELKFSMFTILELMKARIDRAIVGIKTEFPDVYGENQSMWNGIARKISKGSYPSLNALANVISQVVSREITMAMQVSVENLINAEIEAAEEE